MSVEVEGDLTLDKTRLVANDHYAEPLSITNSFGVPSFDPDFWQPDMADAAAHTGQSRWWSAVAGRNRSAAASYIADFVLGARLMREAKRKDYRSEPQLPE